MKRARKDYAAQEAGQAFAYRLDELYSELADMLPPVTIQLLRRSISLWYRIWRTPECGGRTGAVF